MTVSRVRGRAPDVPRQRSNAASGQSAIISSFQLSAILGKSSPAKAAATSNPIDGQALTASRGFPSSEAFGCRPYTRSTARARAGIRNPCVDGPRFARTCCSWGRVWSIAVMCPALICGRVDRGPRWVTRIGPKHHGGVHAPKGFPGYSDPRFDRSPSCCCPCKRQVRMR